MEVDWAGTKIGYYDADLGEMNEASLFVAVLPCSQLMYAEPFRDETLPSWVTGHVNAFGYIGREAVHRLPEIHRVHHKKYLGLRFKSIVIADR